MENEMALVPSEEALAAFWIRAINAAHLDPDTAFSGQKDLVSLCPVAFTGGESRADADDFCAAVLAGKKKVFFSYVPSYEMDSSLYPERGDMTILCDGTGNPRALLVTESVEQKAFCDISEMEVGEAGESSLASWQEKYKKVFSSEAEEKRREFSLADSVIVEKIKVVYRI